MKLSELRKIVKTLHQAGYEKPPGFPQLGYRRTLHHMGRSITRHLSTSEVLHIRIRVETFLAYLEELDQRKIEAHIKRNPYT